MCDKNIQNINSWLVELEGSSPEQVLEWASRQFGPGGGVVLASSMGVEDQILTAMIARAGLDIGIFTLDTGRLFGETYQLIDRTRERYNVDLQIMFPEASAVENMLREHGVNLFYKSVENRKLCCGIRKVEPLKRALRGKKAWLTGLRSQQSVARDGIDVLEWDEGNSLVKINPLASWGTEQVWAYVKENNVPVNSLHKEGYPSIGCAPCTRAIERGEDIRAGRWWWEQAGKKECGLHVKDGKLLREKG